VAARVCMDNTFNRSDNACWKTGVSVYLIPACQSKCVVWINLPWVSSFESGVLEHWRVSSNCKQSETTAKLELCPTVLPNCVIK